ncbi:hypothetical protein TNCV_1781051 [Trichonephila clavipes]|nr:hypothetical protein TNCV_1781051 [Trichonephila clavipes]
MGLSAQVSSSSLDYDSKSPSMSQIILELLYSAMLTFYLPMNVWKKDAQSLQDTLDLLHNLPSEISDVLTDDFSDEEVPANNLLEFSLDS